MNDKHAGANPYETLSRNVAARRRNPAVLVGAVVAVAVVVVAVLAVVLGGGGDDGGPAAAGTGAGSAENATQQTAAVTVTGSPLPEYPASPGLVADPATDPATGEVPPTLVGQTFDGEPIEIDPADGRAKAVVFLAHWCPHCQAEVPRIKQWIDEGKLPADVDMYAVSTSTTESRPNFPASAWIAREGFQPQVLLDDEQGTAASAYGLTGFPYIVVMDKDGKVTGRASGEVPMTDLSRLVDAVA